MSGWIADSGGNNRGLWVAERREGIPRSLHINQLSFLSRRRFFTQTRLHSLTVKQQNQETSFSKVKFLRQEIKLFKTQFMEL